MKHLRTRSWLQLLCGMLTLALRAAASDPSAATAMHSSSSAQANRSESLVGQFECGACGLPVSHTRYWIPFPDHDRAPTNLTVYWFVFWSCFHSSAAYLIS
jgi:hypothetical protein